MFLILQYVAAGQQELTCLTIDQHTLVHFWAEDLQQLSTYTTAGGCWVFTCSALPSASSSYNLREDHTSHKPAGWAGPMATTFGSVALIQVHRKTIRRSTLKEAQ